MAAILQFYQGWIGPFVRYGVVAVAVVGLWVGLSRAGLTRKARMTGIVATVLLLVWLVTMDQLGRSGFYASHWNVMQPLCWAIAIVSLIPLVCSESIVAALDTTIPPWWIIGLQSYRALGGFVFLALWATGRVPTDFALHAGIQDSMVGVFAVVVAICACSGIRGWRVAGIVWNVFGILDLSGGIVRGVFTPYNLAYPALMITAFLAPLSLFFHGVSLWQLTRAILRERRSAAMPAR